MYNLTKKDKIAIVANSKIKKWSLGEYINILSFIPNLKFQSLDWYSGKDVQQIVKQIDFISNINDLNKFNEKKYDHIINLFDNFKNTKKIFYINTLLDVKKNDKENTKSLLRKLAKIYKINTYRIFFNRKKIIKCKYDLFICWDTDPRWKIKRYPYNNFLKIKKFLEKKYEIKIKIQNRKESILKYINNIKQSKIILSVMTLGVHVAMMFNKELVVLIGPNNYDDLKLYQKVTQILPSKRCRIHSRKLNVNYSKCSCMKRINKNKIIKIISRIYEKIS